MTYQRIQHAMAGLGMVIVIGLLLQAGKASAADSTTVPSDAPLSDGDVQSRGLSLPNIAPPPPHLLLCNSRRRFL